MKNFIRPENVKSEIKTSKIKIDKFIDIMNNNIEKGKFSINNSLDKFENLNILELSQVQRQAEKDGWKLTQVEDNYNTTTYIIEVISEK